MNSVESAPYRTNIKLQDQAQPQILTRDIAVPNDASELSQKCQSCRLKSACLSDSLSMTNRAVLGSLTRHAKPLQKGDYIYRQNEDFRSVYIVKAGCVKVCQVDTEGEEHIVGFYTSGEIFGIDGIYQSKHQCSAVSLDTTAVCEVPYEEFSKALLSNPSLSQFLLTALAGEMHERQQPLIFLHHKQAMQRLATFLINMSSRFGKRGLSLTEFSLPMPRRDIAQYLGLTEETVSRLFSKFGDMELVTANGREILIHDHNALKSLSMALH